MTMKKKPLKESVDRGAALVAALLAGVAILVLWQAREFTPFASIFPRAVGTALLICSLLALVRIVRGKARSSAAIPSDGLMRSGLLVLSLLLWVALLEGAGFALSSWVGFFALALIANREPLRASRLLTFAAVALICVLLLQLLFQRGLDVRLPAGNWLPALPG